MEQRGCHRDINSVAAVSVVMAVRAEKQSATCRHYDPVALHAQPRLTKEPVETSTMVSHHESSPPPEAYGGDLERPELVVGLF